MDRLTVLAMFSWQYLLMAFLVCLGIVQIAAARSGRRHLWLLGWQRGTAVLGAILLVCGMALFYLMPLWTAGPWGGPDAASISTSWGPATVATLPGARNINDTAGGLSGHWQALWFVLGWIGAVLFARSIGRRRRSVEGDAEEQERPVLVGTSSGDRS